MPPSESLKLRRALISVSDKTGVIELGRAFAAAGVEIVATGKTASVLQEAGLKVKPIEEVSGSPEAFQGRMKTLSFPVCSGILYRRGDAQDEADLARLGFAAIDCVVVNFYPFEQAVQREGISRKQLIEEVDIGGPTLVRAAAKNAPDVLVVTDPRHYASISNEIRAFGKVSRSLVEQCAREAWDKVLRYDEAIASELGSRFKRKLRYGENPHQTARLEFDPDSPIAWPRSDDDRLTATELSYNNILDLSSAYALASDLMALGGGTQTGVVIVKHNNPCGVALVPGTGAEAQKRALELAWQGDPVSAFGGVLVFTHPLEESASAWLSEKFVELIAAPSLSKTSAALSKLVAKRKNLKAVAIRRFGEVPRETVASVPGGRLVQTSDTGLADTLTSVTAKPWPEERNGLGRFGIAICRALKSNAVTLVRELSDHSLQLVGAGQGQPNRVEALKILAIPRARAVLEASGASDVSAALGECVLVSDAFFPFRDTVDVAAEGGIRSIIQPGGSIKDAESVAACDEHGVAMAFTGVRHFRH